MFGFLVVFASEVIKVNNDSTPDLNIIIIDVLSLKISAQVL